MASMNQNSFILTYPQLLDSGVCEGLMKWHSEPSDVKTVIAERETRRDVQKWLTDEYEELWKPLQKMKMDMAAFYLGRFSTAYRGRKKLLAPESKIQRTDPFGGGFHTFHSEISHWENCARVLVWTIYLNDLPEGEGTTEFLFDNVKVQPKQGLGVIWPAAWMFQHRGNPVHSHAKYIATGWYWYPKEEFYYK